MIGLDMEDSQAFAPSSSRAARAASSRSLPLLMTCALLACHAAHLG
jgi:hypothetical protein